MIKVSKEVYDREAVLKASFAFTDVVYFHLDADSDYYLIELYPKGDVLPPNIEYRFENELIAQQTRRIVSHNTKSIREMIVARALASTVVNTGTVESNSDQDYSAEEILKDWFETHE